MKASSIISLLFPRSSCGSASTRSCGDPAEHDLTDESVVTANIRRGEAPLTLAYFFPGTGNILRRYCGGNPTVGIRINEHRRTGNCWKSPYPVGDGLDLPVSLCQNGCPLALQVIPEDAHDQYWQFHFSGA